MLATIPFAGFYYSVHNALLDEVADLMLRDLDGDPRLDLVAYIHDDCNWGPVMKLYAKAFTENVAEKVESNFTFHALKSPREYNFTTDRIYVNILPSELERLMKLVGHDKLKAVCDANLTSREGFVSFYNPDYRTWGAFDKWDENQAGMVMLAYIGEIVGTDDESDLMEPERANGVIESWIEQNSPGIARLYKINDYLNLRASR